MLYYTTKLVQVIQDITLSKGELVLFPEEGLVTSSRPFLFFIILSIKKDWIQKKK